MASNYWTEFPEKKQHATGKPQTLKAGKAPKGTDKPAFPSAKLPGKAQSKDRSMGVYKCHVYPKSEGL